MAEHEHWQWQEPGGAWKGAGLYHITLTVTDRQPLLGALVTPEGIRTVVRGVWQAAKKLGRMSAKRWWRKLCMVIIRNCVIIRTVVY